MSRTDVDVELRRLRIDPVPTVDHVTKHVRRTMAMWHERGLLHRRTFLTQLFPPLMMFTVYVSCRRREAWAHARV